METELLDFKENKNSVGLLLKYHHLIENLASLCKGTYKEPDALFKWFYGLHLEGQPRTPMNILEARDSVKLATSHLTHQDCYNHIVVFFLELAQTYKVRKKKGTSFNHYIRMVLGWRTKNWMSGLIRRVETALPRELEEDWMDSEEMIQPFTIDLAWVMRDNNNLLFTGLRAYDRYLVYLYFTEGMSIARIAFNTYQSKNTVNADLSRVLQKCRAIITREEKSLA